MGSDTSALNSNNGRRPQTSYSSGVSDKVLLGMTIGDKFDETVERFPDNEALVVRHQCLRLTYRQLQTRVNQLAKGLIHVGLKKGERIGIWSPNNYEWCATQFATSKMGAILVNINPSYRLHELEYALRQSGCVAVIISPQFKTSNYTQMMYDLCPELYDSEPGNLRSEKLPQLKTIIRMGGEAATGMLSWDDVIGFANKIPDEQLANMQRDVQFDDVINIQYTSGTTGFPKGAALTHHNILNNGFFVADLQGITEKDRVCIPVPLYHCFGMVMGNLGCITHGSTMVYPSDGFDPLKVLQTVQEEKCTSLYGVPTMFIAELDRPDFSKFDLSSLRTGVMAGSPCPIEVMKKVNTLMNMREVTICYGMTETSPVSTQTRAETPLDKRVSTVGITHPHLEIKIVNPSTGYLAPIGEAGELCTRGYSVMLGYWNNEKATREAIDPAGWMHTGDLAEMDDEGYIKIVGRIKDMIIRGGENIYPREIEEFLHLHPDISDVHVVGVPDVKYGEEIMVWVKLKPGSTVSVDDLRSFCKGKIAHYKIPRHFKFVDEFPMTVTGKIQKYLMREESIRELGVEKAAQIKTA
ncbi:MAG: AMP-binding protein [Desulfomonilaceae bacterium]